jgi:sugar phosphate isomerase/epimerase
MKSSLSRRQMLAASVVLGTASVGSAGEPKAQPKGDAADRGQPFRFCFNTATIMGQNLPLEKEVEIVAKAGYGAIEPWVRKIEDYVKQGGSLADMKKRIADAGLSVESAIGFPDWINDDDAKRAAGLEQMKRDMDLVRQIGGKRIAAPPGGGFNKPLDLAKVAERYRKVCELGRSMGVVAELELWGRSKTLHRLGEVAYVLAESGHPDACTVLDVFHIYTGGSDFTGLAVFDGAMLQVFHMNDYPAQPPREKAADADRIYPGDGIAPITDILRTLRRIGFRGWLSLELFNRKYYAQDPFVVAKTGLEKLQAAAAKALG